jgi:hypothetical protein
MYNRIDYKIIFFLKWKNFGANVCVWRRSVYVPPLSLLFSFWISNSRRTDTATSRFLWPCGLRCISAAARWLGSLVRIPLRAWMLVSCVRCVGSERPLRRATTHSEFYQLGVSHYVWSEDLNNEATQPGVRLLQHTKTARTFACNL